MMPLMAGDDAIDSDVGVIMVVEAPVTGTHTGNAPVLVVKGITRPVTLRGDK